MTAQGRSPTLIGLSLCAFVLALHAAVLGGLRPVQAGSAASSERAAVSVRMLSAPHVDHRGPAAALNMSTASPVAAQSQLVTQSDRQTQDRLAERPLLGVQTGFAEDAFVPAHLLLQRPVPNADVVVTYPEGPESPARVRLLMTLFIDERGVVAQARADDAEVPTRFVEAARVAFLGATFVPGLTDAGPAKSRLRVEVNFDSGDRR